MTYKTFAVITAFSHLVSDARSLKSRIEDSGSKQYVPAWQKDAKVVAAKYCLTPVSYTHLTLPTNREV